MSSYLRLKHALALAASTVAVVAALGLGATAAQADATPAQKVPLTQTNRNCDGSLIASANQAFGFAVVVRTGNNGLVAQVTLQGAAPDTTYNIRLIQILPDNSDCGSYISGPFDGTLTTDASGDGNANIREPVLPGASSAFVDLNGQINPGDFFTSPVVNF